MSKTGLPSRPPREISVVDPTFQHHYSNMFVPMPSYRDGRWYTMAAPDRFRTPARALVYGYDATPVQARYCVGDSVPQSGVAGYYMPWQGRAVVPDETAPFYVSK